jgi:hypothetical protein
MIEISHKQAQHLIREGMDRRLPDAQWATLQAHLENCPTCSRYRERLQGLERALGHALQARWAGARGPQTHIVKHLYGVREARVLRRKRLKGGLQVGLAALALLLYLGYRQLTAPPPPPPTPPAAPIRATRTPAGPDVTFRGLVAYEAQVAPGGRGDILLLSASSGQVEVTNLTQSPSHESHPAWSPDGEWIAFLSDQVGGKNEVFVMTVAGTRLTRLTDDPGIDWQGPLAWSADGRWLALTGQREQGRVAFLYLVPVEGGAPRSIAGTRGAMPWVRFSSSLPVLAYVAPGSLSGLVVFNYTTGWSGSPTTEDIAQFRLKPAAGGAFDWSLGGRSLVYVADGPYAGDGQGVLQPRENAMSLLSLSQEIDAQGVSGFTGANAERILRAPGAGTLRGASWAPNTLLATTLRLRAGCWTVELAHAYNRPVAPRALEGLCVEGSLERSNWSADGGWLVLVGRVDDAEPLGIYAVQTQMEGRVEAPGADVDPDARLLPALVIERLADAPAGAALRVRPVGQPLNIHPRSAEAHGAYIETHPTPTTLPAAALPSTAGPGAGSGWVYYNALEDAGLDARRSRVFRMRPDGSERAGLTLPGGDCPRPGPSGQVAYRSGEGRELWLMSAEGLAQRRLVTTEEALELPSNATGDVQQFGCPVWSPDGRWLAALLQTRRSVYLAVVWAGDGEASPAGLDSQRALDSQRVLLHRVPGEASLSEPVFLPLEDWEEENGLGRVLLVLPRLRDVARLMEMDLRTGGVSERVVLTAWDDAWGLTLSPDATRLAMVLVTLDRGARQNRPTVAQLRVMDVGEANAARLKLLAAAPLNNFEPYLAGAGGLTWLPNGSLLLVRATSLLGPHKTAIEYFDPNAAPPQSRAARLATFEDVVSGVAWQDGRLILSAESGLWSMGMTLQPPPGPPILLDALQAGDVFWLPAVGGPAP